MGATATAVTSTQLNSTTSSSSSTVSLKEANLAWICHALNRATSPTTIKQLLAWNYELTQEYPLPLPFPVATFIPTSTSMFTPESASASAGETEIYRQTVMPGVGRPVLLSIKAKPTATVTKSNQPPLSASSSSSSRHKPIKPKPKTSGVDYWGESVSAYQSEARHWVHEAVPVNKYHPSLLSGACEVLTFLLAWGHTSAFKSLKFLAFGINRIGRELGWQTTHIRKCLAVLVETGLVEQVSLANGKLSLAEFDEFKAALRPDMRRSVQRKSILYKVLFECRQPLPEFDPSQAQAQCEIETRGEVSETPQLAINTSKQGVAYVGAAGVHDLKPDLKHDDVDAVISNKFNKIKEAKAQLGIKGIAAAALSTDTDTELALPTQPEPEPDTSSNANTTTTASNSNSNSFDTRHYLAEHLTLTLNNKSEEQRVAFARLCSAHEEPSLAASGVIVRQPLDPYQAIRLVDTYPLEYLEAKIGVWLELMSRPGAGSRIVNPIGYLCTVITRDIQPLPLPPPVTASAPFAGTTGSGYGVSGEGEGSYKPSKLRQYQHRQANSSSRRTQPRSYQQSQQHGQGQGQALRFPVAEALMKERAGSDGVSSSAGVEVEVGVSVGVENDNNANLDTSNANANQNTSSSSSTCPDTSKVEVCSPTNTSIPDSQTHVLADRSWSAVTAESSVVETEQHQHEQQQSYQQPTTRPITLEEITRQLVSNKVYGWDQAYRRAKYYVEDLGLAPQQLVQLARDAGKCLPGRRTANFEQSLNSLTSKE